MPPDPARRSPHARQRVLEAATVLLSEVGYRDLTIEGIAARAGAGKQTIYRWWPDKGALVLDAFLTLVDASETISLPDSGDLAADLKSVIRPLIQALGERRFEAAYRALLTAIQDDSELAHALLTRLVRPLLAGTRERLLRAKATGQLANVDPDVAAEIVYAPLYYRWLLRLGPLTPDYADVVVDLVLSGLTRRSGSLAAS
jgi:AcrR family transcriptional regulator